MNPPLPMIKAEGGNVETYDDPPYEVPAHMIKWQPVLRFLRNQTNKPHRMLLPMQPAAHPINHSGDLYGVDTAFIRFGGHVLAVRVLSMEGLCSLGNTAPQSKDTEPLEVPRGVEGEIFPHLALKLSSYPAIATLSVAWIRAPMEQWSEARKSALAKLNRLMRIDWQVISQDWPQPNQVPHYLRALDQLFFAGLLGEHVSFHLLPLANRALAQCGLRGLTRVPVKGDERTRIAIDNMAFLYPHNHQRKRLAWIGTMLHEMAHALFNVYGCRCIPCDQWNGESGHGLPWQEIGTAVNRCLRTHVDIKEPPENWQYVQLYNHPPDDLGVSVEIDRDLGKFNCSFLNKVPGNPAKDFFADIPSTELPWPPLPTMIAEDPFMGYPATDLPWEAVTSATAEDPFPAYLADIPAADLLWSTVPSMTAEDPFMDYLADIPAADLPWPGIPGMAAEDPAEVHVTDVPDIDLLRDPISTTTADDLEMNFFDDLPKFELPWETLPSDTAEHPFMGCVADVPDVDMVG